MQGRGLLSSAEPPPHANGGMGKVFCNRAYATTTHDPRALRGRPAGDRGPVGGTIDLRLQGEGPPMPCRLQGEGGLTRVRESAMA